jgi:hypothetical protein
MKKSVMKKWVKALRSGEYKQTKGDLQDSKGYCCLGVLCDIAQKEGVTVENGTRYDYDAKGNLKEAGKYIRGSSLNNQREVALWAGIDVKKDGDGLVPLPNTGRRKYRNLAALNDEGGKSFKYIANIIEKLYKEL